LIAVGLGDADVDRKIGLARESDRVVESEASAPIDLWQTIDADFSGKPTPFKDDSIAS
jgi:hypothetical protein